MKKLSIAIVFVLAAGLFTPSFAAAPKPGTTCKTLNEKITSSGLIYTCIKSGSKKVWSKGVNAVAKPSSTPSPATTLSTQEINDVVTPYFGSIISTSDGFVGVVINYSQDYVWGVSSSAGSVEWLPISGSTRPFRVFGLPTGTKATVTVSAVRGNQSKTSTITFSTSSTSTSTPTPTPTPTVSQTPSSTETIDQINAVKKARQYLNSSGFSRTGLIKQLNYEGFSNDDSTYAVDSINANWSEQAVRKAAQYLKSSGFSRSGLIKQLVYEGFSNSDSQNAADAQKADWFDQAVRKAAQYLASSAFSRSSLIKQLEYEGFSNSEATYGADSNGFASTPPVKPSQNGSSSSNSNSSTTSSDTPVVGKIISNSKWTAFEVTNPSKTENLTSPSFTVMAATSTGVVLIEARNDKFPMLKAGEKIWMYFPGLQPDVITLTKYPRSSNRPTNPDEWPAVRDAKISGINIEFTLVNKSKTLRLSGESIFHYFGLDASGVPVFADQVKTYQTLLPGGSTTISWPTTVSSIKHSSVVVYIGPVYE